MSVTTVATLRSALGVGTLYTDAVLQSVCDAADQVMLPFLFTNETYNVAHSNTTTEGTLYFEQRVTDIFYVGESVVITKNGTPFNGTKTITAVDVQSISFAVTGSPTEQGYHPVVPFGVVSGTTQTDYTTVDAVKQASLQICEAIWQARQAPSGQGLTVDGYQVSPFTMSNTLLARVRGLLAPYLDPRSMVG
jgi:hypothetical protein